MSQHLDDETLEQYLLGYLAAWRVPAAEEMDAFIRAARKSLRRKPN